MDYNSIDRLIPVIRVFRRRIFQLPAPMPLVENENPPNLSPDHHFDNNSEMESDHDNDHRASPFYYSDSDEDLDDGDVINEDMMEDEMPLLGMSTLGQGLRIMDHLICNFLVRLDLGALMPTLTHLYQ